MKIFLRSCRKKYTILIRTIFALLKMLNTLMKFAVYIVKYCRAMLVLQDVDNFQKAILKKWLILIWVKCLKTVLQQQCSYRHIGSF